MRRLFLTAAGVFALDQVTKYLVVILMDLRNRGEIDVWPPFVNFRMAWNYGVNFGLLGGDGLILRWTLIAVALGISAWVLRWALNEGTGRVLVAAGLLIGGALGNVIDRILYGAVADFLNMSCCGIDNPFSFNVADVAIFLGAVGLILFTGKGPQKNGRDGRGRLR
ncbi:signal peptidase II [Stagnihabitans tardus]|uniref:Lipoprotein signal peptidase n=1 Tax=Stagnihabitans tardus TaxID=2699202 RepID=A0AAE4YDE3_9RHOB|nr:signal peptidase II [Stagnihabitans tardus]NBZ89612.1 signal peptidase II [Stagnihabitans tardus]